jgi:hypothetical protein
MSDNKVLFDFKQLLEEIDQIPHCAVSHQVHIHKELVLLLVAEIL